MENASKALLMAGGLLIAIIIITLLVKSFTTVRLFQNVKLTEEEKAQLVAFNEQYTRYLGQYVYGTEVITSLNRSLDNTAYPITTKIKFISDYSYRGYKEYITPNGIKEWKEENITIKKGSALTITNSISGNYRIAKDTIKRLSDAGEINTMAFKCTSIEYDSYGRVKGIIFEEKKWNHLY